MEQEASSKLAQDLQHAVDARAAAEMRSLHQGTQLEDLRAVLQGTKADSARAEQVCER